MARKRKWVVGDYVQCPREKDDPSKTYGRVVKLERPQMVWVKAMEPSPKIGRETHAADHWWRPWKGPPSVTAQPADYYLDLQIAEQFLLDSQKKAQPE